MPSKKKGLLPTTTHRRSDPKLDISKRSHHIPYKIWVVQVQSHAFWIDQRTRQVLTIHEQVFRARAYINETFYCSLLEVVSFTVNWGTYPASRTTYSGLRKHASSNLIKISSYVVLGRDTGPEIDIDRTSRNIAVHGGEIRHHVAVIRDQDMIDPASACVSSCNYSYQWPDVSSKFIKSNLRATGMTNGPLPRRPFEVVSSL